jgi:hypothetical protein
VLDSKRFASVRDPELPYLLSAVVFPSGATITLVAVVFTEAWTFAQDDTFSELVLEFVLASSTNSPRLSPVVGL